MNIKDGTATTQMNAFTLGHHLCIAHEQYVEHAKVMREAGQDRVADEFDRLARQAEDWATIFQHEETVKVWADGQSLWVTHHDPSYGTRIWTQASD